MTYLGQQNNDYCNATRGILPQIERVLGSAYVRVRGISYDELFVRRTPCGSSRVRVTPPPYADQPRYAPPFVEHKAEPETTRPSLLGWLFG